MNIFFGVDNEMKIALVTGADDFFLGLTIL